MSKAWNLLTLVSLVAAPAGVNATLITYEFSGSVASASSGRPPDLEPLQVPTPFAPLDLSRDNFVHGTFTLDTSVAPLDSFYLYNGALIPVGKSYAGAVPSLSISLLGQTANLAGYSRIAESSVDVIDIPGPIFDPFTNFDRYGITSGLYADLWGADFENLLTSVDISTTHRDLGIITNTQLLQDFSSWDLELSFILSEPETSRVYQLHVPLTSVKAVPEPGTLSLMGIALVLTLSIRRRRGSAAVTKSR
jgi:PEP-CTERM motif